MARDAELWIGDALARYYAAHDLPADGGASLAWFWLRLGRARFPLPYPTALKAPMLYHDVHHVVTGYDTRFTRGELAIAGFEIGAGCGRMLLVWLINLWMFALGLVLTPRALFSAFRRGRRSGSLYRTVEPAEELRRLTVGEVRARLGLTRPLPARCAGDLVAFAAWGFASCAALAATAGAVLAPAWLVVRGIA